MTMIKPEEFAGLPTAEELCKLANSLFPDLSGIPENAGTPFEPEVCAENKYAPKDNFDWEHPFAYGGARTDDWLKGVEAVSDPTKDYLQDASRAETVVEPKTVSYSPAVLSKDQARQRERSVYAPTSLGGDGIPGKGTGKIAGTTRNDSIIIGSKTLAQIREDFPILSEKINGNPLVWLDNGATTQRPRAVSID